jgi:DNA-binding LacI/PurR family transcriptional regulator
VAGRLPTAVFFANYLMAVGGLARLADHGLRVPDDIAVGVFGDVAPMDFLRPRPTRVGVAPGVLARRAAAALVDRLTGRYRGEPRHEVLPAEVRAFESA